jgi:CDGSH-type Zn-finger protein
MSDKAKLNFQKDGPIGLTGEVEIIDAEGNVLITQAKTSFCRCGASKNKPFCDGSHIKIDFKAPADLGKSQDSKLV